MYTELQIARVYFDLYNIAISEIRKSIFWDKFWEHLCKHYDGNMRQVCYVSDLMSQSYQMKKYGRMFSKDHDYKFHLLRGLDQFHY